MGEEDEDEWSRLGSDQRPLARPASGASREKVRKSPADRRNRGGVSGISDSQFAVKSGWVWVSGGIAASGGIAFAVETETGGTGLVVPAELLAGRRAGGVACQLEGRHELNQAPPPIPHSAGRPISDIPPLPSINRRRLPMNCHMLRRRLLAAIAVLAATATLPAAAIGRADSLIKGEEVGYFGGATVTHTVDIFVYSNLGPAAGNHVTVCLGGRCERAQGHNARLAWYSASFRTRGYRMGDHVTFTVMSSDGPRRVRVQVTHSLLCMHNNGSTPQA